MRRFRRINGLLSYFQWMDFNINVNGNVKQTYTPIGCLTFYQISQNTQVDQGSIELYECSAKVMGLVKVKVSAKFMNVDISTI